MDHNTSESKNGLIPFPIEIQNTIDRMNVPVNPNPLVLSDFHKQYQDNQRIPLPPIKRNIPKSE